MNDTVVPLDRNHNRPLQDRSVGSGPFRHIARQSWGLAICAKREGRFVQYLFEGGERRSIATAYEYLMEPVVLPREEAQRVMAELTQLSGLTPTDATGDDSNDTPTLEQQVMVFRHGFPEGFGGEKWRDEHRGEGAPRRLKRHRDAAVAMAQDRLAEPRLRGLLHARDPRAVIRSMVEILRATTLVSKRRLKPLTKLPKHRHEDVAEALVQLLYGGPPDADDYPARFGHFVSTLRGPRRKIHWSLATAIPALVFPEHHVCVRPKKVRAQATRLAPSLKLPKTADRYAYRRVRQMYEVLAERLVGHDLEPRDMLDVHDFMALTWKPSALELLRELDPEAFDEPEVADEPAVHAEGASSDSLGHGRDAA